MAIDSIDTPASTGGGAAARGPSFRMIAIGALILLLVGIVGGGWAMNRLLADGNRAPAATKGAAPSIQDRALAAVGAAPTEAATAAAGQPALVVAPVDGANALPNWNSGCRESPSKPNRRRAMPRAPRGCSSPLRCAARSIAACRSAISTRSCGCASATTSPMR